MTFFVNSPTAASFLRAWSAPDAPAAVGPDVLVRPTGPELRARRDTMLLHSAGPLPEPTPLTCEQARHAGPPQSLRSFATEVVATDGTARGATVLMVCAICCKDDLVLAELRQALHVMETAVRCTATLADDLTALAARDPRQRLPVPTAELMLHLRSELEFAAPEATPISAERLDPHNILRGALAATVAAWRDQLQSVLSRERAMHPSWSDPLVMVTARRAYAPGQHPDRQRCAFPDWSDTGNLYPLLAVAPLAGILTRTGCAPSPVLCLPAWIDLPAAWVSLGPVRTGPALDSLLAACAATFGTDTVDDDVVAAVHMALRQDVP